MGDWHYPRGSKKSQFVKNYIISENFVSNRKSDEKAMGFEKAILSVIAEFQQI